MDKNKVNKKRGSEGGDIRDMFSKKHKDNEGIRQVNFFHGVTKHFFFHQSLIIIYVQSELQLEEKLLNNYKQI